MLLTFNLLVQILFCTAFTNNTKQHGRHWRPLESGLNIPSLWWILPCNNTDAFSCSDTASWLRRSSREEAATTVASNDNTYGIEQNCVCGPLPWPEKSQWLKRITPSVSTETCQSANESAQRYVSCLVSDLLGVATTVCVVVWQPACLLESTGCRTVYFSRGYRHESFFYLHFWNSWCVAREKQQQILVQFFSKIPDAVKCISCRQPVAQELDVC